MNILFIHGAGSSENSFNYIKSKLSTKDNLWCYSYDMNNSDIKQNIKEINSFINTKNKEIMVVGHSLGGILALGVVDNINVKKILTISAPLGGMLVAGIYGWVTTHSMCKDLMPHSNVLTSIKRIVKQSNKPHTAIITTQGTPFFHEENDGVVLVNSQMAWDTPEYIKISLNHFEVLMCDETVNIIGNFWRK